VVQLDDRRVVCTSDRCILLPLVSREALMKGTTRYLLVLLGVCCVALGTVGVFVPILPTTPFLLLAAFLFARSSTRCHRWLLSNRLCGSYLRRYVEDRSMRRGHKAFTLVALWVALGCSMAFMVPCTWARILLGAIGVGVSAHVLTLGRR
jgi:hypothetical protein